MTFVVLVASVVVFDVNMPTSLVKNGVLRQLNGCLIVLKYSYRSLIGSHLVGELNLDEILFTQCTKLLNPQITIAQIRRRVT